MKTNKYLVLTIILLLVVNISAVVTMIYHNRQEIKTTNRTMAILPESRESMQYSGRWFRDKLGFNREQMTKFQEFNPAFRQKVRSINIEMNKMKREMLDEMNAENIDTLRLNALSDSIGGLHAELKKVTYSYYFDLKEICNSEQQKKLQQVFTSIFEGTIIPAGPGKGMQQGRRMRRIALDSLN
ncbi:MAG TPA: periplasmic heavy metal sensor [Bacteroidales bacterium]|nr:periplasmic heavy metal sensor [Bacteroidales bacterium]